MQSTQARLCTIDGCGGKHKARGLCLRHYQLQWASENRDKTRASVNASRAKRADYYREQRREYDRATYAARYARDGERIRERAALYRAANLATRRASHQRWAEAHRAELREKARLYAEAHPERRRQNEARRRARKRLSGDFDVSDRDIARLLIRHGGCCAYCAEPLTEGYHLDHIVPLARGGHHAIGNLAPACPDCNLSKGKRLLTEWQMRQQRA